MSRNLQDMRAVAAWYSEGGPQKLQLPFIHGRWFFVVPGRNSNRLHVAGTDPLYPLGHFEDAEAKVVSGNGDGICLISFGETTAKCTSYLEDPVEFDKWGVTVVGVCAPTRFSQRARIANNSVTGLDLSYMLNVSGSNNTFMNFSVYNGGTTGAGGIKVTGNRNYFGNVHMMGGMGMTTPTVKDYSLLIAGGHENTFEGCVIGSDTFDKTDVAGAEIHVSTGAMRNRFYDCEVLSYRSAQTANPGAIKLVGDSDSITRNMMFKDCVFHLYDEGAVPTSAAVVIGTPPDNGIIEFVNCQRIGYTDWAGVATARVYSGSPTMHEAGGIMIVANPS